MEVECEARERQSSGEELADNRDRCRGEDRRGATEVRMNELTVAGRAPDSSSLLSLLVHKQV